MQADDTEHMRPDVGVLVLPDREPPPNESLSSRFGDRLLGDQLLHPTAPYTCRPETLTRHDPDSLTLGLGGRILDVCKLWSAVNPKQPSFEGGLMGFRV